jgi:hypothetical protein
MGLPDITPGINTAIFFDLSSAAGETPLLLLFFAPHPVNTKTAKQIRNPGSNPFLKKLKIITASGVIALHPEQKKPRMIDHPGLMFWEMAYGRFLIPLTQFSSIRTLPSAPEFHRFSSGPFLKIS